MTRTPALIRATGWGYFPVALIARLPYAMMVVGVMTLVVAARGSLSLAGLTAAAGGIGTVALGPLIGAAADRFGQRHVVLVTGILNSLALGAIAWVAFSELPDLALLAAAFLVGASCPQISPMSRARLVGIIKTRYPAERRERITGGLMAYESAADEVVFVFGPVVVGILATTQGPAAPLIGAAVLLLVFATAFALHPTANTVPLVRGHAAPVQAPARQLWRPRVLIVIIGTLGVGLFFGATLTALTSFMEDRGAAEQAGLVYGAMGIGSALLAIGVAALPERFRLRWRLLCFTGVLLVGTALLPLVSTVGEITLALLLVGLGVGPTLVTLFTLAARRSPLGRSATVMTMAGSALTLGQALASAAVGMLAESAGTGAALWTPLASVALVLLATAANTLVRD